MFTQSPLSSFCLHSPSFWRLVSDLFPLLTRSYLLLVSFLFLHSGKPQWPSSAVFPPPLRLSVSLYRSSFPSCSSPLIVMSTVNVFPYCSCKAKCWFWHSRLHGGIFSTSTTPFPFTPTPLFQQSVCPNWLRRSAEFKRATLVKKRFFGSSSCCSPVPLLLPHKDKTYK